MGSHFNVIYLEVFQRRRDGRREVEFMNREAIGNKKISATRSIIITTYTIPYSSDIVTI